MYYYLWKFPATMTEAEIEAALPDNHTLFLFYEDNYILRSFDCDMYEVRTFFE